MDKLLIANEGIKMLLRRQKLRFTSVKKYKGNEEEICKAIINDCWNGTYLQTSAGHFNLFYIRDFGMCCEALVKLGYKEYVEKTLQFALNVYQKNDRITTTINAKAKPMDVFYYAPDSLAFLLHSLRVSKLDYLIKIYEPFLNKQINYFFKTAIDKSTGLINEKQFSSIKDHSTTKSSCYNTCMAAMICKEIKMIAKLFNIKLSNPLAEFDYYKILKKYYWNGNYFNDGLYDKNYVAGDANTFPFWVGVFDTTKNAKDNEGKKSKKMLESCLIAIQNQGLDEPLPLKYTQKHLKQRYLVLQNLLASNYQGNTIWVHLGLCYMDVIAKYDKRLLKRYIDAFSAKINEHKNFLEIYNADGSLYKTFFYHTDDSMVWCSKYLEQKLLIDN